MRKITMLTPGLLHVSPRVWEAAHAVQLSHRDPLIKEALKDAKKNLKKLLNLSDAYDIVFLGAGGRGAVEAVLSALIASRKQLLITVNGRWSRFMADIAKKYDPNVQVATFNDGEPISVELLEQELATRKPDVLCFVGHETERGLLNPIERIVSVSKKYGCAVFLDAMSSVIVHDIPYEANDVDVIAFSATKAVRSIGGISMVALKKNLADSLVPSANHYLDLKAEYEAQKQNVLARAVLPSNAILALREATEELLEEGISARKTDIKQKLDYVKRWAASKKLRFCTSPEYVGDFSVSFYLPDDWSYESFTKALHEHGYFVMYGFEGKDGRTVEVCTVGYLTMKDIEGFTTATDRLLFP